MYPTAPSTTTCYVLSTTLLSFSFQVSQQCKENIFAIQTLKDFQFVEENKDHGSSVRDKAHALVTLLKDEERLKNERAKGGILVAQLGICLVLFMRIQSCFRASPLHTLIQPKNGYLGNSISLKILQAENRM